MMKYALRVPGGYMKAANYGGRHYNGTVQEAITFGSVATLLDYVQKSVRDMGSLMSPDFSIVRITETPGTGETRRELGETEQARAGETVKYAVRQDQQGNPYLQKRGWGFVVPLADAGLWSTQADAFHAIASLYKGPASNILYPTRILRVAVKANEPVITETVLS